MTLQTLRLRAVWILVVAFLYFSRPTLASLLVGVPLILVGLVVRGWAAGTVEKGRELTVSGPYAFTRNPLYLGSFAIGVGFSVTGGHWLWPALFGGFFAVVYSRTMTRERASLSESFGERYATYAAAVPAFVPRLTPFPADGPRTAFAWSRYGRYREWEALLGVVAALVVLVAKASGWI